MIFNNTRDITNVTGAINVNLSFNSIKPDLERAERRKLISLLGMDQYNDFIAKYTSNSLSSKETILLQYAREVVAFFALDKFITHNGISISDSGNRINHDSDTKTAFQWQIDDNKTYFLSEAYLSVDELLKFLHENENDFLFWKNSSSYIINRDLILGSYDEFDSIYKLRFRPVLTFQAMLPIIKRVETFDIQRILGTAFYYSIKAEIKGGNISASTAAILPYIKSSIVYRTLSKSLGEFYINISDEGVQLREYIDSNVSQRRRITASVEQIDKSRAAMDSACKYDKQLVELLNREASAEKYVEWFDSSFYSKPKEDSDGCDESKNLNRKFIRF